MYKSELMFIPANELETWDFTNDPAYWKSVYEEGVITPIICTNYQGEMFLIAGNRRIASFLYARQKAIELDTLKDKDHLEAIPATVYEGVPPDDRAVWSLIENAERSENVILTWLHIKALEKVPGKWDEFVELSVANKAHWDKFRKLDEIEPELVDAFTAGKITETNLLACATLGARQSYVIDILRKKNKIVAKDIKAARRAKAKAVLNAAEGLKLDLSLPVLVAKKPSQLFVCLADDLSVPYDASPDFGEMHNLSLENGYKLYRLMEV